MPWLVVADVAQHPALLKMASGSSRIFSPGIIETPSISMRRSTSHEASRSVQRTNVGILER
jgi:hypothetical protein